MIPRILRTAVGFGGGFAAIWLVYNVQPKWLGIVAGIVVFFASIVGSNVVHQMMTTNAPNRSPPDDRTGNPPSS